MTEEKPKAEFLFRGLNGAGGMKGGYRRYPCFMYREDTAPLCVQNEAEEADARGNGYDSITAGAMANPHLTNWFWDLEDMSPKQLRVFAAEEYGVDLPEDAGQDKLFAAVVKLARHAPQNQNRLVLMAHEIYLEYDATLEEIRRLQAIGDGAEGYETETVSFEVML